MRAYYPSLVLLVALLSVSNVGCSPREIPTPVAQASVSAPPPLPSPAGSPAPIATASAAPAGNEEQQVVAYLQQLQALNAKRQQRNRDFGSQLQNLQTTTPGTPAGPGGQDPILASANLVSQSAAANAQDVATLNGMTPPEPCQLVHNAYIALCRRTADDLEHTNQLYQRLAVAMRPGANEQEAQSLLLELRGENSQLKASRLQEVRDGFGSELQKLAKRYPSLPTNLFQFPVED